MDIKKLFFLFFIFLSKSYLATSSIAEELLSTLSSTKDLFFEKNDFFNTKNENLEIKVDFGKILNSKFKRHTAQYGTQSPTEHTDVYVLQDLSPIALSPLNFAYDLEFFMHEKNFGVFWYIAALEHKNGEDFLVLYRQEGPNFLKINQIPIRRGLKIHVYTQKSTTYIVTIEDEQLGCKFCKDGSSIFEFDQNEFLHKIQNIDILYPSHVALWNDMNDIFLAVTQKSYQNQEESLIYKWLGRHFDLVQSIRTSNAQKIVTFTIDHIQFLAVANHNDESGETEIYSEIFIYDIHDEKFVPYQKILTHAAVDIKYFCFKQGYKKEHFLVVANGYEIDLNGQMNFDTISIIYKFVDDYFVPFQSLQLSHVNEFLPIVGPNSEFALLAFCEFDGIRAYQYDGWRFVANQVTYNNPAFTSDILKAQVYRFHGGPIIVTVTKTHVVNVLRPTFIYQNPVKKFNKEIEKWCQSQRNLDLNIIEQMKNDFEGFQKRPYQKRTTRQTEPDHVAFQEAELRQKIEELEALLTEKIVLEGDILIKNLTLTTGSNSFFKNLNAEKVNDQSIEELIEDVFFLDENFQLPKETSFENVKFDSSVIPEKINDQPLDTILKISNPKNILIVDGNVTIDRLNVTGKIGGVGISDREILRKNGAQILGGELNCKNLVVDQKIEGSYAPKGQIQSQEIKSINIENLVVKSINGFQFPGLRDLVWEKSSLENVQTVEFEKLIVKDFKVGGKLSGTKVPEDLVLTEGGTFRIQQDLTFFQPLEARNLHVIRNLNQIQSKNGKLQVLLKNSPTKQFISEHFSLDNLHLESLIKLQGQIESSGTDLDQLNPVVTIDDSLVLTANFSIDGSVTVWDLLKFEELHDFQEEISFSKVQEKALKLTEEFVELPTYFGGGISTDNLDVTSINGIDLQTFYVSEIGDLQSISELQFSRNIHVDGVTNILGINGHKVQEVFDRSLRISGDQIITGNHRYGNVKIDSIDANFTNFLSNLAQNEVQKEKFFKKSITLEKDAFFENLEANNVIAQNLNGQNLPKILEDTIFFSNLDSEIFGFKTFQKDLESQNLGVGLVNDLSMDQLKGQLQKWSNDVIFYEDFQSQAEMSIQNLYFTELNEIISQNDFGRVWLLKEGDQKILKGSNLSQIYCNNLVTIRSGLLNQIDFKNLFENARRIDREEAFTDAHMGSKIFSESHIKVDQINGIPVQDFLISNSEQNIFGDFNFLKNLTINGYLFINGPSNGVNFKDLCNFANPHIHEENKGLSIMGKTEFSGLNSIKFLSDFDLKEIRGKSWHVNDEIYFDGVTPLENVKIEGDLIVEGFVDNINLEWTLSNYFSKSKNQNLASKIVFENAEFMGNLISPVGQVSGNLGNINLEKFLSETLRHDLQNFENQIVFDEIEIVSSLNVDCLVNGLNFTDDVFRRDILKNVFRGSQIVENLATKDLKTPEGTFIQGISTSRWLQNLISKNESTEIFGTKSFKNIQVQSNIHLANLLNEFLVTEDLIMTKNSPQLIKSQKIFENFETLKIKNLKLRGLLNGFNITNFLETQMKISEPSIFVENSKIFKDLITAENINFQSNFHGNSISNIINDILKLDSLNNFGNEYRFLKENSQRLLENSKTQAWYLDYYQIIQTLQEKIWKMMSITNKYGEKELVFHLEGSNILNIYSWNLDKSKFVLTAVNHIFTSDFELINIEFLEFGDIPFLFLEAINKEDGSITGSLHEIESQDKLVLKYVISDEKISGLTSFKLPNGENCIGIVYEKEVEILCRRENGQMYEFQVLEIPNGKKITSMDINSMGKDMDNNFMENYYMGNRNSRGKRSMETISNDGHSMEENSMDKNAMENPEKKDSEKNSSESKLPKMETQTVGSTMDMEKMVGNPMEIPKINESKIPKTETHFGNSDKNTMEMEKSFGNTMEMDKIVKSSMDMEKIVTNPMEISKINESKILETETPFGNSKKKEKSVGNTMEMDKIVKNSMDMEKIAINSTEIPKINESEILETKTPFGNSKKMEKTVGSTMEMKTIVGNPLKMDTKYNFGNLNPISKKMEKLVGNSMDMEKIVGNPMENPKTPYLFVVCAGYPNIESRLEIWKLDTKNWKFVLSQMIFVTGPNDLDTIYYQGVHYLVVSSSYIHNSKYYGRVIVSKYDPKTSTFVEIQDLYQKAPLKVKFAILPSNELFIYILTKIPTEPLVIYEYAGIAGFSKKIDSSTIPSSTIDFDYFTSSQNKHFIITYNATETNVVQAVFKGRKSDF